MNKNSKEIFEKAKQVLAKAEHEDLLLNYLDCVMKDKRRDPFAVDFFIKNGGLSSVYDNIANIKDELIAISNELTEISDELEEEDEWKQMT